MSMLENLRYPWVLAILLLGQLASIPIAAAQLTRSELIALVPAALSPDRSVSVSYTHLDVYKRQVSE